MKKLTSPALKQFEEGPDIDTTGKLMRFNHEDVTISYSVWDKDLSVTIQSIKTRKTRRGLGLARTALGLFLQKAEEFGRCVYLAAAPLDQSTNLEGLVRLYESFGFKKTSPINGVGGFEMERKPTLKNECKGPSFDSF